MTEAGRPLRIWLVLIGEALPIDPGGERQLRMSLLAETLVARGHQVTWWASAFDHSYKKHRYPRHTRIRVSENYELYLLRGMGYRKNVSLARIVDHYQIARAFRVLAPKEPPPDLILSVIPTPGIASEAVQYGRSRDIPVVIDIRDLWPDILRDLAPPFLRPAVHLALLPMFRALRLALRGATAITAVSPSYLDWALKKAGRPAGPDDRVFFHGYPVLESTVEAQREARTKLLTTGVDPTKLIVWFLGILGRTYDVSTVVEAARVLEKRRNDIQFVISGEGDNAARWRSEAAGLRSVVFTGWVAQAEIAQLMAFSAIGLAAYAPGAPQSLPNKIFEYMHAGLPVLSSLRGGDAEQVLKEHGCGFTYPPGDAAALAEMIEKVLDTPGLREGMSRRGQAAFAERYSAASVYGQMADHLVALARRT